MLIRRLEEIKGTEDAVDDGDFISRRFILSQDGMGYSVHDTIIRSGDELHMWYKNHLETVYCIEGEGEGEIEDLTEGGVHPIAPGTLYALNNHQKHVLRCRKEMRLLCVFNPPLTGQETHDKDGSYPLLSENG